MDGDRFDHRLSPLGGEFVGNAPAGRPTRGAEDIALVESIDLDDHAIDLIVELGSSLVPSETDFNHLVDIVGPLDVRIHRQAQFPEPLQCVVVIDGQPFRDGAGRIGEERQVPRGGDAGVEQLQRAGGGVARIREGRLARLDPDLVQCRE